MNDIPAGVAIIIGVAIVGVCFIIALFVFAVLSSAL